MAAYAQGKGWKLHIVSAARQKFWGKSLELIPEGSNKLEFEDGNVFTWEKPSSFVSVPSPRLVAEKGLTSGTGGTS